MVLYYNAYQLYNLKSSLPKIIDTKPPTKSAKNHGNISCKMK